MARRIRDIDRSRVSNVDLDKIGRQDVLFWNRIDRVLLTVTIVINSYNFISLGHVHWFVVSTCACVLIASLFLVPTIVAKYRDSKVKD